MTSLRVLTEKPDVGSKIAWVGEEADVEDQVYPKTVTSIEPNGDRIRVNADGIRGGTYFYRVDDRGNSEAFFVNPNKPEPTSMGPVVFAELTNTDDPVAIKRGYHDSR